MLWSALTLNNMFIHTAYNSVNNTLMYYMGNGFIIWIESFSK